MNYIYIDTKIEGTIYQLVEYFRSGVFNSKNYCVYYKNYKKVTKNFRKIFQNEGIEAIGFKKYSELSFKDNSIVFYLFNAQSNCRIVANRRLTHVFVTHGESNKVSSVKPIIRIYDYVITAGKIGVQRYLDNGIFFPEDVARNRIIMMGDTFIGDALYVYSASSKTLLYAPTWEGGIPEENYSSLEWDNIFEKILNYTKKYNIKTVIIQPHPNLGHRDKIYLKKLYDGIKLLLKKGIKVILVKNTKTFRDLTLVMKYRNLIKIDDKKVCHECSFGITDISAIEAMLYVKKIPSTILYKNLKKNISTSIKNHYDKVGQGYDDSFIENHKVDEFYLEKLINYTYPEMKIMEKKDRLALLAEKMKQHILEQRENAYEK